VIKYGQGYIYIYNPEQKDFYLSKNISMVDSQIHRVTKNQFWVFKYEDVQEAFGEWCTRNK
jgi:hypothetical protein